MLRDYTTKAVFDGQMLDNDSFRFGKEFYMGDIVQTINAQGQEARSRVTELVHTESGRGVQRYPTFTTVID